MKKKPQTTNSRRPGRAQRTRTRLRSSDRLGADAVLRHFQRRVSHPVTVDELAEERVSISLPSLRVKAFDVRLAAEISRVRKTGFTFAPEAGSERLRRVINKHLDRDDDRWLYLPGLDLVKRISAGDKRTSFVGAHYFYEDVSGRRSSDDSHELLETTDEYYVLQHAPIDSQSADFVSYTTWIDRETFLPMKIDYQNAAGKTYRRVEVLEVETIEGHPTVVTSRVSDLLGGGKTDMQFRYIGYDIGLPEDVFPERSLRNPPQDWLQRPGS